MLRLKLAVLAICLIFSVSTFTIAQMPPCAMGDAMVLTHGDQKFQEAFVQDMAALVAPYARAVRLAQINAPIDLNGVSAVVYLSLDPIEPIADSLKNELEAWVADTPGVCLFLAGYDIHRFSRLTEFGLTVSGADFIGSLKQLSYIGRNGQRLLMRLENPVLKPAAIVSANGRLEAEALGQNGNAAIIVSGFKPGGGRVYYFGFHPTAYVVPVNGAHLAFLDILNEAFGVEWPRAMLIRVEDVNAATNPAELTALTGELKRLGLPYTLAVTPVYVKPGPRDIRRAIGRDDQFRAMIKAALAPNTDIVVHGYTHQLTGETGVDTEFVNSDTGKCISPRAAGLRVRNALQEFSDAGLATRVVGWETPHYDACEAAYHNVFERRFGYIFEDVPYAASAALRLAPAPIHISRATYFQTTPLGFVEGGSEDDSVARIVEGARVRAGLRHGAVAAFYIHPSKHDWLPIILDGLVMQGWTFATPRTFGPPRINWLGVF